MDWQFFFALFAVVILFLYGIEQFSTEIRNVAGKRFRSALQRYTRTRIHGAVAGALITGLVQSSTATTVITVGLVNAGVLSFMSSLGIIFGANVGTTITAQLIAFNLTSFAPVFIVIGFLITIVGGKYRVFGRPVFFFGLVFFSMSLVSTIISPYQNDPFFIDLFASISNPILLILAGFLITSVFQSSAITVGLIVIMSMNGIITPAEGIPVVLGANLGTPTTALLVSLRMNKSAKRTAVAQFLFNFLGVLIFIPFLTLLSIFVSDIGGTPAQQIANAHLIFNVTCAVIFLILLRPFAYLVTRLVPAKEDEIVYMPKYLSDPLPFDLSASLKQVENEIRNLINQSEEMLTLIITTRPLKQEECQRINQLHDYATLLEEEVQDAILTLSRRDLSPEAASQIAGLSRIADLSHLLGDQVRYLSEKLKKGQDGTRHLSEASYLGFIDSGQILRQNLSTLVQSFPYIDAPIDEEMRSRDSYLRVELNRQYEMHLHRMVMQQSPGGSLLSEILSSVETVAATIREIRKTMLLISHNEIKNT